MVDPLVALLKTAELANAMGMYARNATPAMRAEARGVTTAS
jgi:hypothetical protein